MNKPINVWRFIPEDCRLAHGEIAANRIFTEEFGA